MNKESEGTEMRELEDIDFDKFAAFLPCKSELAFSLNGMSADEYIAKVTDEINGINLESIPVDRWDLMVAFSLGMLGVAGDFFIGDPGYKHSLANKNGPFCKWLKQFHDPGKDTPKWIRKTAKWLKHDGQSIDTQDFEGGKGAHRAKSFSHDLPLAFFLYRKKPQKGKKLSAAEWAYNIMLFSHDLLVLFLVTKALIKGTYWDFEWRKDGTIHVVSAEGKAYNPLFAPLKYIGHMLADFCSAYSLPIPGFSFLMHFPDRDVEAFALKLYKNGMNSRTLVLQGFPVLMVEWLTEFYLWIRKKGSEAGYSDEAWEHKKNILLLISHGITMSVNVGKVILAKAPWRLNLVVIVRTCQQTWRVINGKTELTNRHIEKLDAGVLKNRIESAKTLVLLDDLFYETEHLDLLVKELNERTDNSVSERNMMLKTLDEQVAKLDWI